MGNKIGNAMIVIGRNIWIPIWMYRMRMRVSKPAVARREASVSVRAGVR
jgi:hypothetical protein